MLGALVCFLLVDLLGLDSFVSLVVLGPVFFLVGVLFERGLMRTVIAKTGHEQLTASVLVTLGLSLCIEDMAAQKKKACTMRCRPLSWVTATSLFPRCGFWHWQALWLSLWSCTSFFSAPPLARHYGR